MNTEVSLNDLQSALSLIQQCTEQMGAFLRQANSAAAAAVASVGGPGTAVGSALQSHIVSVNEQEFIEAQKSLNTMIANVGEVNKIYHTEQEDLLSAIQNYNPNA